MTIHKKDFYLVTTSLEETWPRNSKVLFLGEWCVKERNRDKLSSMDFMIADPYGLDCEQKKYDLDELNDIYNRLLVEISVSLNEYHKTSFSKRYWEIIVGHWLRRYIKVISNRYKCITQALSQYSIKSTTSIMPNNSILITSDFSDFSWSLESEIWNHAVYTDILESLGCDIQYIAYSNDDIASNIKQNSFSSKYSKNYIKIANILFNYLQRFSRDNDAFILNSYLPKFEELKLHILLRQVPQMWTGFDYKVDNIKDINRQINFISYENFSGVEREVRRMLIKMMPVSYLEGYNQMCSYVKNLPWPLHPRFIFTSSDFMSNEVFKFWCAIKSEQGCKYFVGQHGNNYGTQYGLSQLPEYTTSDNFLSWGWQDNKRNVIPAFNFKIVNKKSKKTIDNKGGLLIVNRGPGKRDGPQDRYYENKKYQESVSNFYLSLDDFIKRETIVRMHHISYETGSDDRVLWESKCKDVNIDDGLRPITELIDNSKITIFTYDSTGVLESLALNRPTICYWPTGLCHVLSDAMPYYKKLQSVGIITDNPSELISEIWDDVGSWWYSDELQRAVGDFCDKYSKVVDKPIRTLKDILTY